MADRAAMMDAIAAARRRVADNRAIAIAADAERARTAGAQPPPVSAAGAAALAAAAASPLPDFVGGGQPALRVAVGQSAGPSARSERPEFISEWASRIEAFARDDARSVFELPSALSGFDRKTVHELAAKFNLSHNSTGAGATRRLVLRKDELSRSATAMMAPTTGDLERLKVQPWMRQRDSSAMAVATAAAGGAPVAEKDLVANKAMLKAMKRMTRVADPYARAVHSAPVDGDINEAQVAEGAAQAAVAAQPAAPSSWAAALEVARLERKRPRDDGLSPGEHPSTGAAAVPAAAATAAVAPPPPTMAPASSLTPVAEMAELARSQGLPDGDVTWVEKFTGARQRQGVAQDRVAFLLDPADIDADLPPLPVAAGVAPEWVFVRVQARATGDEAPPVTPAINSLLQAVERKGGATATGGGPVRAVADVVAGFTPVEEPAEDGGHYTTMCMLAVAVRGGAAIVEEAAGVVSMDGVSLKVAATGAEAAS